MFKAGTFTISSVTYQVYEISTSNFYRLDIMEADSVFQKDIHKMKFSLYKKTRTFTYGDVSLYRKYKRLIQDLIEAKLPDRKESAWERQGEKAVFVSKYIKGVSDDMFIEQVKHMNADYSERYVKGDSSIILYTLKRDSEATLPPNTKEYTEVTLKKSLKENVSLDAPYVLLDYLRKTLDIEHLFECDYKYISTVEETKKYMEEMVQAYADRMIIGVDTETSGLDFNVFGTSEITGIVISIRDGEGAYFPFTHINSPNLPWEMFDYIMKHLMSVCGQLVAHNKKFDCKVFYAYGYVLKVKHDSMIASILKNPSTGRGIHGLKQEEYNRSGKVYIELSNVFPNKKNMNFAILPEDIIKYYACPDPDNTRKVLKWRLGQLPKDELGIYDLECELAMVKAQEEYWGIRLDEAEFNRSKEECEFRVNKIVDVMNHLIGRNDFNYNSPEALIDLLYNKMGYEIVARTRPSKRFKDGRPSTSAVALEKLASVKSETTHMYLTESVNNSENALVPIKKKVINIDKVNNAKYPLAVLLTEYRKQIKRKTGFYDRLTKGASGSGKFEKPVLRFISWINQLGAASGRQSSPLHQLPKELKKCVVADSDDHILYDQDFSQIELRVLPAMANEPKLKEMCCDPDIDIHRAINSIISKLEVWEITAEMRQQGKRRNFGVVYMISPGGLAVQMFGASPTKENIKWCENSMNEFFHEFKRITSYLKENEKFVLEHGYIKTKFGRYRYFYQIFDENISASTKNSLVRQANNMPVQGTAADILKMVEVNMQRWIEAKGWDKIVHTPQGDYPLVRQMLSIHDEILVSGHKSIPPEEILKMVRECMELKIENFPPLFADTCIVHNWVEAKGDEYAIPPALRDQLISDYEKTGKTAFNMGDVVADSLQKIADFGREELDGYMEGIIKEVGLDAQAIADKVRHPRLTHDLIGRYYDQTHDIEAQLDKIKVAVDCYLEYRKGQPNLTATEVNYKEVEDVPVEEKFGELEETEEVLYDYDPEGNVVYNTPYDEEQADDDITSYKLDTQEFIKEDAVVYVWELFDKLILETGNMKKEDILELLQEIANKYYEEDGFMSVYYVYAGELHDAKFKVESVEKEWIEEWIDRKSKVFEIKHVGDDK